MKRHLIVGLAITSSLMLLAPLGATAATTPRPGGLASPRPRGEKRSLMRVFDLNERPLVRPRQFVISGTSRLADLHWRGWGGPRAVAIGNLEVNTCEPNCAQGENLRYRAQLQLRGDKEGRGGSYYAQYRVVGTPSMPPELRHEYGKWTTAFPPSGSA